MNAKNLPIQVVEEWQGIAEFMKEQTGQSGLAFDIKVDKTFGIKIFFRDNKKIWFEISDYVAYPSLKTTRYLMSQIPEDRYTSIGDSIGEPIEQLAHEVKDAFSNWVRLVRDFVTFGSFDMANLFQQETEELLTRNEPNLFSEEEAVLTYCLKNLSVTNFQGIKQASIENLPVDTSWAFLVGENGFGKSTILQAIALWV